MRLIKAVICAFVISGYWIAIAQVHAQTLTQDQPLSFGLIGMIPSETSGDITIDLAGTTTASGAMFSAMDGQFGTFSATGVTPPFSAVSLSAAQISPLSNAGNPPGATLSLSNFLFPSSPTSNAQAKLTFDMGATLSTDGTISQYGTGAYTGSIVITLIVP